MRTAIAFAIIAVCAALMLMSWPVLSQVPGAAPCVPHNPYGLNFCPLVPAINGIVTAIAALLTAAAPVITYYGVVWLRNHGIAAKQSAQKVISDRMATTIQNGLKFASSGADVGGQKLLVTVDDPAVRQAANYAIVQSPDLLKRAGIDVTTEAGQQILIRRIIAESQPAPANAPPVLDINMKTS